MKTLFAAWFWLVATELSLCSPAAYGADANSPLTVYVMQKATIRLEVYDRPLIQLSHGKVVGDVEAPVWAAAYEAYKRPVDYSYERWASHLAPEIIAEMKLDEARFKEVRDFSEKQKDVWAAPKQSALWAVYLNYNSRELCYVVFDPAAHVEAVPTAATATIAIQMFEKLSGAWKVSTATVIGPVNWPLGLPFRDRAKLTEIIESNVSLYTADKRVEPFVPVKK